MVSTLLLDVLKVLGVEVICNTLYYVMLFSSTLLLLELIITSGGENVAPVPIENNIKQEVPFLSNVMVVGDHRNYLTCLLTLKVSHWIEWTLKGQPWMYTLLILILHLTHSVTLLWVTFVLVSPVMVYFKTMMYQNIVITLYLTTMSLVYNGSRY